MVRIFGERRAEKPWIQELIRVFCKKPALGLCAVGYKDFVFIQVQMHICQQDAAFIHNDPL